MRGSLPGGEEMTPDFTKFSRFELPPFECRSGWHALLHDLLSKIDALLGPTRTIAVDQIKEKFGALRFYWHGDVTDAERKQIEALVRLAARVSAETCEICSERAMIHPWNGGFWQSNCVTHAREAILERKKPPNGTGWWLATSKWRIVDPVSGKLLPPDRLDRFYGEARATLDAHRKQILGDEDKLTQLFGARVHIQQAANEASEFVAARFVCGSASKEQQ
jgi:hypothetical protein